MQEKVQHFSDLIQQIITYLWVIGLSGWGGAIAYFNKMSKYGLKFSFIRFLIEIVTAGFVGVVTFLLCDSAGLNWTTTAAMVGISGHMGTRALFIIEKRYEVIFGKDDN